MLTNFHGNEAKEKKNLKKKFQNGRLKKRSFSISANSQYFFSKFSWMGPWVSRIDWCKGHWWDSTYMAVRLSDISSKTAWKHEKYILAIIEPPSFPNAGAATFLQILHASSLQIPTSHYGRIHKIYLSKNYY